MNQTETEERIEIPAVPVDMQIQIPKRAVRIVECEAQSAAGNKIEPSNGITCTDEWIYRPVPLTLEYLLFSKRDLLAKTGGNDVIFGDDRGIFQACGDIRNAFIVGDNGVGIKLH
jgi:hypothetical protein